MDKDGLGRLSVVVRSVLEDVSVPPLGRSHFSFGHGAFCIFSKMSWHFLQQTGMASRGNAYVMNRQVLPQRRQGLGDKALQTIPSTCCRGQASGYFSEYVVSASALM